MKSDIFPESANQRAFLTSFVAREQYESDDWFIDSGASRHMTMRKDLLLATRIPCNKDVIVADNADNDCRLYWWYAAASEKR